MRHLEAVVPEHAVLPICNTGCSMAWLRLVTRTRRRSAGLAGRKLPYTQKIWFPYHIYTFEMTSRKDPGIMQVSVEAWSGAFAIFQLEEHLSESALTDGEIFSPKLSIDICEPLARDNLIHTIMRQRSRFGGKPVPGDIIERETILYPLWVFYYARQKDLIDIKLVDGMSGRQSGHRTRSGVLEAFVAKKHGTESGEAGIAGIPEDLNDSKH